MSPGSGGVNAWLSPAQYAKQNDIKHKEKKRKVNDNDRNIEVNNNNNQDDNNNNEEKEEKEGKLSLKSISRIAGKEKKRKEVKERRSAPVRLVIDRY